MSSYGVATRACQGGAIVAFRIAAALFATSLQALATLSFSSFETLKTGTRRGGTGT